MSRHWKPPGRVTPFRRRLRGLEEFRGPIVRRGDRWDRRPRALSGTTVAVVLAVAACLGLAVGLEQRSEPVTASNNDGVRASFGLCHTGGGVNCVVDGDTFYIGGSKVRIAGIDAPETHDFQCPAEKALGDRATAELYALLNSGAVTMTSIDRNRDAYGRLLRNVTVDGADVGEALIGAGMAREYGSGRRGWC
jgi:micrococcal nuclease